MGSSTYSHELYRDRVRSTAASGTGMFTHTHDIRSGKVISGVHESLDPSKPNKAGALIRESCDSDLHPDSVAVAIIFDVTGSMSDVPRKFVEKLPKLMGALVKKGYVEHPHVLFGAVGDARFDRAPLQVGQFEGGNEMDAALGNIYLEGGGGNNEGESYDLALYYMARHTDMDCVKKRGKKGYLFLLGDEPILKHVSKEQVERVIGDKLQGDIPIEDIIREVEEKFELFWILPQGTAGWGREHWHRQYRELFGQRFLKLENPEDVCELVVSAIGVSEGYDIHDIASTLKSSGSTGGSVDRAVRSITPYVNSGALAKRNSGSVEGALTVSGAADSVARI